MRGGGMRENMLTKRDDIHPKVIAKFEEMTNKSVFDHLPDLDPPILIRAIEEVRKLKAVGIISSYIVIMMRQIFCRIETESRNRMHIGAQKTDEMIYTFHLGGNISYDLRNRFDWAMEALLEMQVYDHVMTVLSPQRGMASMGLHGHMNTAQCLQDKEEERTGEDVPEIELRMASDLLRVTVVGIVAAFLVMIMEMTRHWMARRKARRPRRTRVVNMNGRPVAI